MKSQVFFAVVSFVGGLSAVTFAAYLSVSRPRAQLPREVSLVAEPTDSTSKQAVPSLIATPITLPEVKVVVSTAKQKVNKKEPEMVQKCREVGLDQGAEDGKTVVYCEWMSATDK